jgi:hypothetical protein
MLAGRVAEVVAVSVLATIVTAAIAAPVLRAPSERLFGMEIVGRHHDPFTVMEQFEQPITVGVYLQPVTDITGALFARLSGAVAAYNWLVLLSFPLSAAAAYLLARHLMLSPAAAAFAAMAYAFSPFHLAHAAYHPHIAQTQWVALYVLALWRCLDTGSPASIGFLGAATVAVTLSNFYAGMIVAVITPVAVAAYWLVPVGGSRSRSIRGLAVTAVSLTVIAASGMAYAWYAAGAMVANRTAFAFPRVNLFIYSAKWWSYLIPPVGHPLLGAVGQRVWNTVGVHEGLLEQQVSLGWGIIALGLIACFGWFSRQKLPSLSGSLSQPRPSSLDRIPVLTIVAVAAVVCSLSPERMIGTFTFVRPSALLYTIVPMFRSYARFGVVVQLMAAMLAGIGVDCLRRAGNRYARGVCFALVALVAAEYAVVPSAMSRDVLPTAAHRWIMRQPGRTKALDCTPLDLGTESVQWLTSYRVTLLPTPGSSVRCTDANWLAANGYTHLLLRTDATAGASGQVSADRPPPEGLRLAARFDDGRVFAVMVHMPPARPGDQP